MAELSQSYLFVAEGDLFVADSLQDDFLVAVHSTRFL